MADKNLSFRGRNSNRANTAFTIGLFTILIALSFEYFGGFVPCELCHAQRTPYYVGLPLLAIIIGGWEQIPVPIRISLTLIAAAIFAWGIWMSGYHAGVEWKFWAGPTSCTGNGGGVSFGDLSNLNAAKVVPCDEPQIRFGGFEVADITFTGFSFAGLNAIISLLITGFVLWSAKGQYSRWKQTSQ